MLRPRTEDAATPESAPDADALSLLSVSPCLLDVVSGSTTRSWARWPNGWQRPGGRGGRRRRRTWRAMPAGVEADPNRLASVEDRRAALGGAHAQVRRLRSRQVLGWAEGAGRIDWLELDTDDDGVEVIAAERDELRCRWSPTWLSH